MDYVFERDDNGGDYNQTQLGDALVFAPGLIFPQTFGERLQSMLDASCNQWASYKLMVWMIPLFAGGAWILMGLMGDGSPNTSSDLPLLRALMTLFCGAMGWYLATTAPLHNSQPGYHRHLKPSSARGLARKHLRPVAAPQGRGQRVALRA